MANKYRKIKFQLHKELFIILGVIAAILLATILLQLPTKNEKFVTKWSAAGSSITNNTLYEEVSFEKLDKKLADEKKVVVLFVSTEEANSAKLLDEVSNKAAMADLTKVYVVDATSYLGEREKDEALDSSLKTLEEKYGVSLYGESSLWYFESGKLKSELNHDLLVEASYSYSEPVKRVLAYVIK